MVHYITNIDKFNYFSTRMLCVTLRLASLILSVKRFDAFEISLEAFSTQREK